MIKWHIGHIFALAVLFFIGFIFIREMRVVLMMIEIDGFDPIAYEQPTYKFAIRGAFFALLTILVGYKTRIENLIIGNLLFLLGGIFFLVAGAMIYSPKHINILYLNWYWNVYAGIGAFLSFAAIFGWGRKITPLSKYNDEILDDLL